MIRAPYFAKMRMWQDDPTEIDVRWFKCPESALTFPYPTVFGSTDMDFEAQPAPVGEVVHLVRPQRPRRGAKGGHEFDPYWSGRGKFDVGKNNLGYKGVNWCGPAEALSEGGRHGSTPEIVTDAVGLNLCCLGTTPTLVARWCRGWSWSATVTGGLAESPTWCRGWSWSATVTGTSLDLTTEAGEVITTESGEPIQIDVG